MSRGFRNTEALLAALGLDPTGAAALTGYPPSTLPAAPRSDLLDELAEDLADARALDFFLMEDCPCRHCDS